MNLIKYKLLFSLFILSFYTYGQEGYKSAYSPSACPGCKLPANGSVSAPQPSSSDYNSYKLDSRPTGIKPCFSSYDNSKVNLYTGVPEISIPLYTISGNGYTIPISLDYDASGIKVDQEAGVAGLGWNLIAASSIRRQVRGEDDFIASSGGTDDPSYYSAGIYSTTQDGVNWDDNLNWHYCGFKCMSNSNGIRIDDKIGYEKDLQTDIFYFNAGGYSGKFILGTSRGPNRKVYLLEQEKIKVTLIYNTNVQVPSFKITTPDGFQYYYGDNSPNPFSDMVYYLQPVPAPKYTSCYSITKTEYNDDGSKTQTNHDQAYMWHLSKIITPNNETITFDYISSHDVNVSSLTQQPFHVFNSLTDFQNLTPNKTALIDLSITAKNMYLSTINFLQGNVYFVYSPNNDDYSQRSDNKWEYLLKEMMVFSRSGNISKCVKDYTFTYDYFNAGLRTSQASGQDYTRLKLTKITEKDCNSSSTLPPYTFIYNESINFGVIEGVTVSLPSKKSMGRDHWGYCNNKNIGETQLKPTSEVVDVNGTPYGFSGLNRDVDPIYAQAGILTRVTYPTGGYTEFTYESNDYNSPSSSKKIVGGLRMKTIRVSDGISGKDMYTSYLYNTTDAQYAPSTASSGVLMKDIMYTRVPNSGTGWPLARSGNSILPDGIHGDGNVVGYTRVSVLKGLNGELGKTIYDFSALPNYYYDNLGSSIFKPNAYYEYVFNNFPNYTVSAHTFTANTVDRFYYIYNGLLVKQTNLKKKNTGYVLDSDISYGYEYNLGADVGGSGTFISVQLNGTMATYSLTCCTNYDANHSCAYIPFPFQAPICSSIEILNIAMPYNVNKKVTRVYNKTYDETDPSKFFTQTKDYSYSATHRQLSRESVNTANLNAGYYTDYFYPADFINKITDPANIINIMGNENLPNCRYMHNKVLEAVTFKYIGVQNQVVKSTLYTYKFGPAGTSVPAPIVSDKIFSLETTSPLSLTTSVSQGDMTGYFIESINKSTSSSFNYDNDYSSQFEARGVSYDTCGKILESQNRANISTAYIYGYSNTSLIAKALNSTRSQITYAGFESGQQKDDDGWDVNQGTIYSSVANKANVYTGNFSAYVPASTGSVIYGPAKDVTPLPQTGKYKLSCYVKSNSNNASLTVYTKVAGDNTHALYPNISSAYVTASISNTNGLWQYYEILIDLDFIRQSVPATTTLSLRCFVSNNDAANGLYIDEIRLAPVNTEMETYTNSLLVGNTSVANKSGISTIIEYDNFNRVKLFRDYSGNIIKKFNYVYKP